MYMRGRDGFTIKTEITGRASIAGNGAFKAQVKSRSDCGINAHAGHHAAEQELVNVGRFQMIIQVGFPEAVWVMLDDYRFVSQRLNSMIDLYSRCIRQEEGRTRAD